MEAGEISGKNLERVTSDGRIICHDIKCHLVIKVLKTGMADRPPVGKEAHGKITKRKRQAWGT